MGNSASSAEALRARIAWLSSAYYEGNPEISDDEFDALVAELRQLDPVEAVGSGYVPTTRKRSHRVKMLSLAKVHSLTDVHGWLSKLGGDVTVSVEPKWDGSAIALYYDDEGNLDSAVTRGDGYQGEDVTAMVRLVSRVPLTRNPDTGNFAVGEVMLSKTSLELLNQNFAAGYANTRNGAAGLVRRTDSSALEMASYLTFHAHDRDDTGDVAATPDTGPRYVRAATDTNGIDAAIEELTLWRSTAEWDIDGIVIKVLDSQLRASMGDNGHAPRWAVAYKFEAESRVTTLEAVSWSTGRTGRVVPTVRFTAVELVGANTTRATMHNLAQFNRLSPHVGDRVFVKRSGDVIPYVVSMEPPEGGRGEAILPPTVCPSCGSPLRVTDVDLLCDNADCNLLGRLLHALAVFQIDGVAYSTVYAFIEHGLVTEERLLPAVMQLARLREEDIAVLPRFGEISSRKVAHALGQILDPQFTYVHEWIALLGLKGIGTTISRAMADAYGSVDAVVDAVHRERSHPGSISVTGLGPFRVSTLVDNVSALEELRDVLADAGLRPLVRTADEISVSAENSRWHGKKIVVTGTIEGVSRTQAHAWLEERGAVIQGSVSSNTDLLIAGERAGSKLDRARGYGVSILTGDEFLAAMNEG